MSVFNRLDRLTSRTVDKTFAIRFEVQPGKVTPNGRPGPDPDREPWEGRGVLEETPNFPPVEIGKRDRTGNDLRAIVAGSSIELSVDRVRYPQASQARQGDRLQTDDLRRFEISSVKPDGLARVVFSLVELR
jgi:hypothetical protein